MILLEFAAQGIRGVAPAGGRATLRPGYNVVAADGQALHRLLKALFYPDPRDAEALPRPKGAAGVVALRAGLTLIGNDRITYRLVRDFQASAQLHRFDAEKRSFALVASELTEIAAFLQATAGVPPAKRLSALLSLSAAELPSRQAGGSALGGAAAAQKPARSGLSSDQLRKRVAQLKGELERAKLAEKVQAQVDELQGRLFKVDEVLKGGALALEGLAKAEAGRAELEPVAVATAGLGDVEARLLQFERSTARRDEAQARVAAEREALDEADGRPLPGPAVRDPSFWGGIGAGVLFLLIGLASGAVSPGLRYLMLLDIPAFGWSGWVALCWVRALEERERVARRRRVVEDWEKKVEAQYTRDAGDVLSVLKGLSIAKLSELRDALGRLADADAVVAEWRRRLADWEASPEASGARAEKVRIEEEQRTAEAQLAAEAGGFVRDPRSIQTEIQRLEAEAAAPAPAPAAAPVPRPPVAPGAGTVEPLRALLERAAAQLGSSPSGAGRALAVKASQALAGLSFQRLSALQVDDRGGVHAVVAGRPTPAMTLAPTDRDLVYLALKLALLEQALQGNRAVGVVEDAFAGLSDGSRRFAARLLKQMARAGQLLHATTDAVFREAADHTA